ncbi:hypothetical protein [Saccharothrix texasensis]|uniref:DUF5709 domain-containing protein n=1 Tax=Saccharothrix texasensis TaxID=103734 RepID=A0A3N1H1Q9_9PSEU|nr:hypothetical protein [Saccharothrix texasensis]ROP36450.1 hypothetical protein EDD40_1720 [Saccharothrix texasensis]
MSEQQEAMEPRWGEGAGREPLHDPETAGPQYTAPDDDGDFVDEEQTSIAAEAGSDYLRGPEDAAMHIVDEDGRPTE